MQHPTGGQLSARHSNTFLLSLPWIVGSWMLSVHSASSNFTPNFVSKQYAQARLIEPLLIPETFSVWREAQEKHRQETADDLIFVSRDEEGNRWVGTAVDVRPPILLFEYPDGLKVAWAGDLTDITIPDLKLASVYLSISDAWSTESLWNMLKLCLLENGIGLQIVDGENYRLRTNTLFYENFSDEKRSKNIAYEFSIVSKKNLLDQTELFLKIQLVETSYCKDAKKLVTRFERLRTLHNFVNRLRTSLSLPKLNEEKNAQLLRYANMSVSLESDVSSENSASRDWSLLIDAPWNVVWERMPAVFKRLYLFSEAMNGEEKAGEYALGLYTVSYFPPIHPLTEAEIEKGYQVIPMRQTGYHCHCIYEQGKTRILFEMDDGKKIPEDQLLPLLKSVQSILQQGNLSDK